MRQHLSRTAIQESFDNLPSGICFFQKNGLPVLCNRRMHALVYALTGRDLQMLSDLTSALEDKGDTVQLPDGSVWQFRSSTIQAEDTFTQFLASDVTELVQRKKDLEISTAEHARMVEGMKEITVNVSAITREEEILAMKMHIHSRVGWFLQRLRRYREEPDPLEHKAEIVTMLTQVANALHGEIGKGDTVDPVAEMCRVAASLGVTIQLTGQALPASRAGNLVLDAIRECVTNTLRHARGNRVFVTICRQQNILSAVITNNGKPPQKKIQEGGGFGSLRRQIERAGGSMTIESCPQFRLRVTLPLEKEGENYG